MKPRFPASKELVAINHVAAVKSIETFVNLRLETGASLVEQVGRELGLLIGRQTFGQPLFEQPPTFGLLQEPQAVAKDFARGVVPSRRHEVLDELFEFGGHGDVHACSDCHTQSVAPAGGCVKF